MLMLAILFLLLALFALSLLFVAAFKPWRALTAELSTAPPPEYASKGRAAHRTARCHRPISDSPRKRWRRTPGMQSGLPPPTLWPGRTGLSACSNAWRAAGCAVCMGTQAPARLSWFGV